jgi:hypothetical protein
MSEARDSAAEQRQLSFERRADATLVVRLSGTWSLSGGFPSPLLINREIESGAKVPFLVLDAGELLSWDTRLLTYILELAEMPHVPSRPG